MRRLFVKPEAVKDGRVYITDKNDIVYLSVVLRMKAGNRLLVFDGQNGRYETSIIEIDRDRIVLSILAEHILEDSKQTRITLYQGMPKGAKMDEIVRKATELGVFRIVPVLTARTIGRSESGIPASKRDRWSRIAEEAARQSRRLCSPKVEDALTFESAMSGLRNACYDLALVPFELEENYTIKQALRKARDGFDRTESASSGALEKAKEIAVFIGPEGGFEQEEINQLTESGAVSVTIGETILRTETAGPAVVAMILYEFDL